MKGSFLNFEVPGTTEDIIKKQFPRLKIDSDFAWSNLEGFVAFNSPTHVLGRTFPWIEPDATHKGLVDDEGLLTFWPDTLPCDDSLKNYMDMFRLFGFTECYDPRFDSSKRKILLYAIDGKFKSVARVQPYGLCTTKMGSGPIVTHHPESLVGGPYGKVEACMSRDESWTNRQDLEVINKYGGELAKKIFTKK